MTSSTLPQSHEHRKIEKLLLKLAKVKPHPHQLPIATKPQPGSREPVASAN